MILGLSTLAREVDPDDPQRHGDAAKELDALVADTSATITIGRRQDRAEDPGFTSSVRPPY